MSKAAFSRLSSDTKAYACLILCCFSYFYNYLLFSPAESIFMGLSYDTNLWISIRYLGVVAMKSFSLPVWDNYFHHAISMINKPLYPMNLAFDALCALFIPNLTIKKVAVAYGWFYFLHYCLMAIWFYRFVRFFKVAAYASVFGSIVYTLNAYSIEKLVSPFFLINLTFAPLFLLYLFKIFAFDSEKGYFYRLARALPLSMTMAIMITSGFPLILMYTSLIIGPVFVWKFLDREVSRREFVLSLCVFLTACLVGIVIAFPEIYMQLNYVKSLTRYSFDVVRDTSWAFSPMIVFLYPVFPDLFQYAPHQISQTMNYWELAYYFGLSTLIFGFLAIVSRKRETILFVCILILAIVYSLGIYTHINAGFYYLFKLSHVPARVPSRGVFVGIVAMAFLASVGFEYFIERAGVSSGSERRPLIYGVIAVCSLILLIQILAFSQVGLPALMSLINNTVTPLEPTMFSPPVSLSVLSRTREHVLTIGLGLAILTMLMNILLIVHYIKNGRKGIAVTLFTAVLLLDLGSFSIRYYPPNYLRGVQDDFTRLYMENDITRAVKKHEVKEKGWVDTSSFRLLDLASICSAYSYDSGIQSVARWEHFTIYPSIMKELKGLFYADLSSPAADLFNIKYMLIPRDPSLVVQLEGHQKFDILGEVSKGILLRNKACRPRVYFADSFERMDYDAGRGNILSDFRGAFDKVENDETFVYLDRSPGRTFPGITNETKLEYRFIEYGMSSFRLSTSTSQDTLLVLSEIYYPKWKARIDGGQTDILRANYFYRAIVLPEGNHEVEFYYDGGDVYRSLFYFLFAFSVCLVVFVVGSRKKGASGGS